MLAGMFGVIIDEAGCFGLTFFILGFASIELSIGLLFLIVLRRLKISISLEHDVRTKNKLFARTLAINLHKHIRV